MKEPQQRSQKLSSSSGGACARARVWILSFSVRRHLEAVKYAVVLVQLAQLAAEVLVHVHGAHRARLHLDIPHLER